MKRNFEGVIVMITPFFIFEKSRQSCALCYNNLITKKKR